MITNGTMEKKETTGMTTQVRMMMVMVLVILPMISQVAIMRIDIH